jgi:hypothetical protein
LTGFPEVLPAVVAVPPQAASSRPASELPPRASAFLRVKVWFVIMTACFSRT